MTWLSKFLRRQSAQPQKALASQARTDGQRGKTLSTVTLPQKVRDAQAEIRNAVRRSLEADPLRFPMLAMVDTLEVMLELYLANRKITADMAARCQQLLDPGQPFAARLRRELVEEVRRFSWFLWPRSAMLSGAAVAALIAVSSVVSCHLGYALRQNDDAVATVSSRHTDNKPTRSNADTSTSCSEARQNELPEWAH